jgi:diguanylate cyclase (GGDEF)-like protein
LDGLRQAGIVLAAATAGLLRLLAMFRPPTLRELFLAAFLAGLLLPLIPFAVGFPGLASAGALPLWLELALAAATGGALAAWGLSALLKRSLTVVEEAMRAENPEACRHKLATLPAWAPAEVHALQQGLARLARQAEARLAQQLAHNEELRQRLEEASRNLAVANEALATRAFTDQVTGLGNRRALWRRLAHWERAAPDSYSPMQLLLFRLEDLNTLEAWLGPEAQDAVLATVAQRLERAARPQDFLVRYGCNEFLLLMRRCPPEVAAQRAQQIRETLLREPVQVKGEAIPLKIALGTARLEAPLSRPTFAQLLRAAAQATAEAGTASFPVAD